MSRGCRLGGRNTRATGGARHGQALWVHSQRLRYKRSAERKRLKSLRICRKGRELRYKMSGVANPLF
jgi:hypothetical protein